MAPPLRGEPVPRKFEAYNTTNIPGTWSMSDENQPQGIGRLAGWH